MSELKPCPFCGADADYVVGGYLDGGKRYRGSLFNLRPFVKVTCRVCQSRTANTSNHHQAAARWNSRIMNIESLFVEKS